MIDFADGVSVITPERLENLRRALKATQDLPGDMAELGVYRGGSAKVIAATCPAKILHLFDTFTGLPYSETVERDPERYVRKGMFSACSEAEVRMYLGIGRHVYHPGLFPASAEGFQDSDTSFSFVHVDCDLYDGARDAIRFFWPRMVHGGIMFFDDYNCKFTGVTEAVDEVFHESRIMKQTEPSTGVQIGCYVVKGG